MKKLPFILLLLAMLLPWLSSCQEDFLQEIEDRPTETIEFKGISASRDTVCMYDTIVLTAVATGEHLKYTWQRAKGSLMPIKDEPDKVYFWGCTTCCGDLSVSCTVENEFGAYTREVKLFVYPWYSWQTPWSQERLEKWIEKHKK